MSGRSTRSSTTARRLVESMTEAVAIAEGRLPAARRHRRTVRDAAVVPPPRYDSARVRELREHLGLSQTLFARALNVSVATVRSWEQGARVPDGAARRLLELVERRPQAVLEALRPRAQTDAPELEDEAVVEKATSGR